MSLTPFDIVRARIAKSLLPDQFDIIEKGKQAMPVGTQSHGRVKGSDGTWKEIPKGHAERQAREEEQLAKIKLNKTKEELEAMAKPSEKERKKEDVLRDLDVLSEKLGAIEQRFRNDKYLPKDNAMYQVLSAEYDKLYAKYKLYGK